MKRLSVIVTVVGCASGALAQGAALPAPDAFAPLLAACASSQRLDLNVEIKTAFSSIYKDRLAKASKLTPLSVSDFLAGLSPTSRLDGLHLYTACVVGILNGTISADHPASAQPLDVDLPAEIVTQGGDYVLKARDLTAQSDILSFPSGSHAGDGTNGVNGASGRNGEAGNGGAAGDSAAGGAGQPGEAGRSGARIQIEADTFTGELQIDNSGQSGGAGGRGGSGGKGGIGGIGSPSVSGLIDCHAGPGNGGQGGNGGAGGDGAAGGDGGSGGPVIIRFKSASPGSRLVIRTKGASAGQSGHAGLAGRGGPGGARGNIGPHCTPGGRNAGAAGIDASDGRVLGEGRAGADGRIEVTVGGITYTATGDFIRTF